MAQFDDDSSDDEADDKVVAAAGPRQRSAERSQRRSFDENKSETRAPSTTCLVNSDSDAPIMMGDHRAEDDADDVAAIESDMCIVGPKV